MLNNKDVHTIENKDINIVICCPDQIAFWLTGLYITTSYGMWSALSRPICQNHSAMPRKFWQRLYQVKLKFILMQQTFIAAQKLCHFELTKSKDSREQSSWYWHIFIKTNKQISGIKIPWMTSIQSARHQSCMRL